MNNTNTPKEKTYVPEKGGLLEQLENLGTDGHAKITELLKSPEEYKTCLIQLIEKTPKNSKIHATCDLLNLIAKNYDNNDNLQKKIATIPNFNIKHIKTDGAAAAIIDIWLQAGGDRADVASLEKFIIDTGVYLFKLLGKELAQELQESSSTKAKTKKETTPPKPPVKPPVKTDTTDKKSKGKIIKPEVDIKVPSVAMIKLDKPLEEMTADEVQKVINDFNNEITEDEIMGGVGFASLAEERDSVQEYFDARFKEEPKAELSEKQEVKAPLLVSNMQIDNLEEKSELEIQRHISSLEGIIFADLSMPKQDKALYVADINSLVEFFQNKFNKEPKTLLEITESEGKLIIKVRDNILSNFSVDSSSVEDSGFEILSEEPTEEPTEKITDKTVINVPNLLLKSSEKPNVARGYNGLTLDPGNHMVTDIPIGATITVSAGTSDQKTKVKFDRMQPSSTIKLKDDSYKVIESSDEKVMPIGREFQLGENFNSLSPFTIEGENSTIIINSVNQDCKTEGNYNIKIIPEYGIVKEIAKEIVKGITRGFKDKNSQNSDTISGTFKTKAGENHVLPNVAEGAKIVIVDNSSVHAKYVLSGTAILKGPKSQLIIDKASKLCNEDNPFKVKLKKGAKAEQVKIANSIPEGSIKVTY